MCGQNNKSKETAKIYINTTDKEKVHVPLLVCSKTVTFKDRGATTVNKRLNCSRCCKIFPYLLVKENYAAIQL